MNKNKIRILELTFFIFYFFIIDMITVVQLRYAGYTNNTLDDVVISNLAYLPVDILYFLFYLFHIKQLLLKKQFYVFAASVLLFIVLLEFFLPLMDWLVAQASFLPADVRNPAASNLADAKLFPRQAVSLTLINIGILSGLGYLIKALNEEVNIRKLKEYQLQMELEQLKNQLHPHFFFNTLNNIYSLALYNSEKTADTIAQLSRLMRYIIYDCKKEKVPLCREVEFMQNYIQLEQIRHDNNTSITFSKQGNMKDIEIEPLLFLPLIENAFKHGLNGSVEKAWVEAALIVFENEIVFQVKNSLPCTTVKNEKGVGLANINKRLELLYRGRFNLSIKPSADHFEVVLNLFRNEI